eukprot:TRINITY_DN13731_c0_g3_i1.p1 TRINITY_DN13731_c0_g3~~TRINITY_DN13731_c0_g3_i1.p1  ORF type:complete len:523 (+),score=73.61 TRINITY_DN13731_c0_g3_i1:156-1724(+)
MTCPICLELYKFPVTLQCGHNVCKGCILGSNAQSGGGRSLKVTCTVCRQVSRYGSESEMVINQNLMDLIDVMKGDAVHKVGCSRCEKVEATLHCAECGLPLCSSCSDIIHVGRLRQHKLVYSTSAVTATKRPPKCGKPGHSDYRTDLYCVDCTELLCVLCSQTDFTHRTHKILPVKEAGEVERSKLRDVLEASSRLRSDLRSVCSNIDDSIANIERSTTEELLVFERTIDSIKERLDAKKSLLMQKARVGSIEQIDALRENREMTVALVAKLNEAVAKVERAMTHSNYVDIMTSRVEMERELMQQKPVTVSSVSLPQFSIPKYKEMVEGIDALELEFHAVDDRIHESVIEPSVLFTQKGFKWEKSTYGDSSINNRGLSVTSSSRNWETIMSCTLLSAGVHYWEVKLDRYDTKNGHNVIIGVVFDGAFAMCDILGEDQNSMGYNTGKGTKTFQNDFLTPYGHPCTSGDVIGVKLDLNAQVIEFFRNGLSMGPAFGHVSRPCYPAVSLIYNQTVSLLFPTKIPM